MPTLQDQAQGLKVKMSMLAMNPGYIDTGATTGVRHFYEVWRTINMNFIKAGYEDASAHLSFVEDQLRNLLENFPADKTTIGILEVFPQCFESKVLFGCYIVKLEEIARARPTVPA